MQDRAEILCVQDVSKEFERVAAVSHTSFEVRRGEIFGLLGPNGAGKTTLIRMILGILWPDSGQILFEEGPLPKQDIGYLPEERGLYDERRVRETLLYMAGLHGMPPARAHERILSWLDRLDLSEHLQSRVKELSKGMQQKVQFIASVLHEPELAVLDEPFAGLDPPSQDLFSELIRDLTHQGMTVLLSSHQMNLVENLCDRVFLIHKGQRVLYGDLAQLKRNHGINVVTMRFAPQDPKRLENWLSENGAVQIGHLERDRAELLLSREITPNRFLQGLVNEAGIELEELSVAQPSLHRIFVDVVRGSRPS